MSIKNLIPKFLRRKKARATTAADAPRPIGLPRDDEGFFGTIVSPFFPGFDQFGFGGLMNLDAVDRYASVRMSEDRDGVTVSTRLGDFDDDDLDVRLSDGVLRLRGEKVSDETRNRGGCTVRRVSRRYIENHLALPDNTDAERAEAKFRRGRLTVRIPWRSPTDGGRRVPIPIN